MKLENHKYAQYDIVHSYYMVMDTEKGKIVHVPYEELVSYSTSVGEKVGPWVYIYGHYSVTTSKHIRWWLDSLGLSADCIRKVRNMNMTYNIATGEVVPVKDVPYKIGTHWDRPVFDVHASRHKRYC